MINIALKKFLCIVEPEVSMNAQIKSFDRIKALSVARQAKLRRLWDERVKNPSAFVPSVEKDRGLSDAQARAVNKRFGEFASDYLKRTIGRLTCDTDIDRRLKGNRKIVAVGYGRGYDSMWLREATEAGFQTWWVDVSAVAWLWATADLGAQFKEVENSASGCYHEPIVKIFEIQSLLADPEKIKLDLGSIEIWYMCRLLNCLSTPSARVVLQEIGRTCLGFDVDPFKFNAVVIINALADQNTTDESKTSIVRSKKMILANLRRGAGRPVESRFVEFYQYFGKLVTAMTIMAR